MYIQPLAHSKVAEAMGNCNAAVLAAFAENSKNKVKLHTLRTSCLSEPFWYLLEKARKVLVVHNATDGFRMETGMVRDSGSSVLETPGVQNQIYARLMPTSKRLPQHMLVNFYLVSTTMRLAIVEQLIIAFLQAESNNSELTASWRLPSGHRCGGL